MRRLASALAALALVAGACGGGDSDGAAAPTTGRPSSALSTTTIELAITTTSSTTTTPSTTTTAPTTTTTTTLAFGPPALVFPDELASVAQLVRDLERDEESGELEDLQFEIDVALVVGDGSHETIEALDAAAAEIASYLEANPDDMDVLILFGRLGRIRAILQPQVTVQGDVDVPELPPVIPKEELHDALSLALDLDPSRADAAYWQARLYGLTPGFGPPDAADVEQAIHYARLATTLEPANAGYRLALATYLHQAGQTEEAVEVLDLIRDHPFAAWLRITATPPPVPEEAIPNEWAIETFLPMVESIPGVSQAWGRAYIVPGGLDEIESFYQSIMPNFTFLGCETVAELEDIKATTCAQGLTVLDGTFAPATDAATVGDPAAYDISLVATEYRGMPADATLEFEVAPERADLFCVLYIVSALAP